MEKSNFIIGGHHYGENFGFLKHPIMLYEYVFVLIPGVRYGAVQIVHSRWLWFASCSGREMILPAADSFSNYATLELWGLSSEYLNGTASRGAVHCCWTVGWLLLAVGRGS